MTARSVEIELLRQKMILVASEKGLGHEETIAISQQLDKLIHEEMEERACTVSRR